jgi:hypothetical protein
MKVRLNFIRRASGSVGIELDPARQRELREEGERLAAFHAD